MPRDFEVNVLLSESGYDCKAAAALTIASKGARKARMFSGDPGVQCYIRRHESSKFHSDDSTVVVHVVVVIEWVQN